MLSMLTRNWWALALRGGVAVLFGIIALVWPGIALETLILLFGFYAILDGVTALFGAFLAPGRAGPRWLLGLAGAAGIAAGIFALSRPDLTSEALLYLIAAWAIVTGIFEVTAAIAFGRDAGSIVLYVLGGVLSVIFGGLLFVYPSDGILALLWVLGFYAILVGITEIVAAFKLRSLGEQAGTLTSGRGSQQPGTA